MKLSFTFLVCFIALTSFGQSKKNTYSKFGKVSVEDLKRKVYSIDSSANAVILSDIGETVLEGNSKSWFSLVSKRHTVVHVLNKNGYKEASVQIPLYLDGSDKEKLNNLKAVTYNLENDKIVETKLDKSSQFTENVDKNHQLIKFTMPQVKEGSIIEYQYEVVSDFISILDPWYFQSLTAPTLWSEFNFSVPAFFSYNFLNRGYLPLALVNKKDRTGNFTVSEFRTGESTKSVNFSTGVTDYTWAVKDAPELKEESYTFSVRNHISRIEFQLASQNEPLTPRNYRSSWPQVMEELLKSERFGLKLNSNNNWMSDEVKPLYSGVNNNTEKAIKIFTYVRDNFKSTIKTGIFMDQTLKNVFKTKKGSVAEINLLLTAMLRYAGIDASPVLISTTGHGYAFEFSPMISSFNYVVVQCNDGEKFYYLDASEPRMGFNKLPLNCYNGHARIANAEATSINFSTDLLKESKSTIYFFANKEDGKWGGSATQTPGFYESYNIRNTISETGKEQFSKDLQKQYGPTSKIARVSIDSLHNYETPVALKYDIELDNDGEDILYINPTFAEGYKKNPFTSSERNYPVEMPYTTEEIIISTLEVPAGYIVDELPKQMLLKLDEEGKTYFEYRISQSNNVISFMNRIKINPAMFMPDAYPMLREFFSVVVKKQNEQIVFKKKK